MSKKLEFNKLGQWRLVPTKDPYDAVNDPEKYANRDSDYKGVSAETDIPEEAMREFEVHDAKAFRDHEAWKNPARTSNEAVVPSKTDHVGPVEDMEGIEKRPPETKTVGILFDEHGRRKDA